MRVEFNSLHWDNVDRDMLNAHKSVMEHFEIPMNYWSVNMNHGKWMDHVFNKSDSDVIVILEPDCIPIDKEKLISYIRYAYYNETFVGIAQVSNHIPPKTHIYAAPGMYAMSKKAYIALGSPSFSETHRSDTAEEITYIAESRSMRYRSLMPTHFEREPAEGLWPLASLGYYGIGTVFDNAIYHLYQSRMAENIETFIRRCEEVKRGKLDTSSFYSSTLFNYEGTIVR
jgi:hypothetical protein